MSGGAPEFVHQDDPIDHPPHYVHGKIEPINVIEDWKLGHHLACVIRYVCRSAHKGQQIQDLKKARWYLDRFIGLLEER